MNNPKIILDNGYSEVSGSNPGLAINVLAIFHLIIYTGLRLSVG